MFLLIYQNQAIPKRNITPEKVMKLWMVVKDYLNLLVLNHQKILKLVLRFTELAFSAFFVAKIKPATEPVSKNHGPMLRYALIAINNKLYNYDFGRETYYIKCVFALVFIPSLVTHLCNLQSLYSVTQVCSTIFEVLCMLDVLNTTQSEITYCILLTIKAYRMFDLCLLIYHAILLPIVRSKKPTKLERVPQKDSRIVRSKGESISLTGKRQSELEQEISKLNGANTNNQKDSTNDSVGSSLPTNDKCVQETEEKPLPNIPIKAPSKILQKEVPVTKFPTMKLHVKTSTGLQKVELDDPYKFDHEMSKLTGLSTQELLHIKLNYSIQIHRIAKNQAKRELKLHAFYVNLMAEYTSALMLADD